MKHLSVICTIFILFCLVTNSSQDIDTEEKSIEIDQDDKDSCDIYVACETLKPGQYLCAMKRDDIDINNQQPRDCNRDTQKAPINCTASTGICCNETKTKYFTRDIDCKCTNGYHFDTALMLSIFLGMFGVDRFYLGYPAIGLLKFSTLGFFFLGHLLDIILIASQIVGPADGSNYVIDYFGAGLEIIQSNDETARRRQQDWF